MKLDLLRNGGRRLPSDARSLMMTVVLSIAAGLSAVVFLVLTNLVFAQVYLRTAARSRILFTLVSFGVIVGSSLIVGWLLTVFAPQAAGSGIPQLKVSYWKEMGYVRPRSVLIKLLAGVLSIGGGNSLGREGPSVFIGGGVSSNLAAVFGVSRRERRGVALIGGAAGLAAAFNTPLAAITFIIEEILGDLNSRYLGRVVLSAVLGAFTVHALIGRQPAFSLPSVERVSWGHYLVVPFAAALAALTGVVFHRWTLSLRSRLRPRKRIPAWMLPVGGGLITWTVGITVFWATGKTGVFGLGYHDLSALLNNGIAWKVAGVLAGGKLIATVAGYSFGGCGGIFAPSLFIGGMAGAFVSGLADMAIALTPADKIVLAAVGMSACLGAIVRAPLTSILIVFEMTHQFELVPGLLIGTIVGQAVARLAGRHNFYDAVLVQDGHEIHKIHPPLDLQSWQNLPVSALANPNPVSLRGFEKRELEGIIERYPYGNFPVLISGELKGIVTRDEIEKTILAGGTPEVQPAVTCFPDQTVREIGDKFMDSSVPVLVVLDRERGVMQGIVTLHDLIRAQAAIHN